ncbi:MAG TPA: hypothetical protein VEY67_05280, partial [Candidatus Dormibacteraeota bacterium]|nr:hypothetical protein [Candidatus Dormibacteraeota bacterium]
RAEDDLAPGVVSVAAPIMRGDGIVAALGLVAPGTRATTAWTTRARRLLRSATELVAGRLAAEEE